ncbi:Arc family DNA binding domain-containing protein [Permianibacter sp. IMCC34836]|nr:Arc family DNA binding domain-containing protein [Permianibacter fluminis]
MQRWADDDLRSLNAQIEWALRDALRRAGRVKAGSPEPVSLPDEADRPSGKTGKADKADKANED